LIKNNKLPDVAGQCPYFIYDYKEEDIIGLKER
jgi:hypothetical protein